MAESLHANTIQWKIGLAALGPACSEAARAGVKEAVDRGFQFTQDLVHVDTGRLKASGRVEEHGDDLVVTYGGDEYGVDYAGWVEIFDPYLMPGMDEGMATYHSDPSLLKGPFGP